MNHHCHRSARVAQRLPKAKVPKECMGSTDLERVSVQVMSTALLPPIFLSGLGVSSYQIETQCHGPHASIHKNLPCSTTFILGLNLTTPFPRAHERKIGNSAVQDVENVSAIHHFPQIVLPLAFGLYLNMGGTWNCHQRHGHKTDKRGPKAYLRDLTHTHIVTGWMSLLQ